MSNRTHLWHARHLLALVILTLAAMLGAAGAAPAATVVSIEFDDGWADQYVAGPLLAAHGMHGTFFVISRTLGQPDRMTWAQVRALSAAGHEIGGHTLTHPHLPTMSADEQRRQICDDRATLMGQGLAVRSFAYPYGQYDATTRSIVAACGYRSARGVDGISAPTCTGCRAGESIPPADPYATRTPVGVNSGTTLATLQAEVTHAEQQGGGWVQVFFHQICDGCGIYGANQALLSGFLDWLAPRAAQGTVVRTVGEVVGGSAAPAVLGPPRAGNLLPNPSLETDANADGVPDCWQPAGFGVNTYAWARVADAHTGLAAEQLAITTIAGGDRKLITTLDAGACAPWATPGRTFTIDEWYRSTARLRFVMYSRSADGVWTFWTKSPYVPASTAWTATSWTTPALPANALAVSGGLTMDSVGTATFDDVGLTER